MLCFYVVKLISGHGLLHSRLMTLTLALEKSLCIASHGEKMYR